MKTIIKIEVTPGPVEGEYYACIFNRTEVKEIGKSFEEAVAKLLISTNKVMTFSAVSRCQTSSPRMLLRTLIKDLRKERYEVEIKFRDPYVQSK